SFCVTLYEALYGRRPFAGETVAELARDVSRGARLDAGPPRSMVAILRRGLALDPEARFPSMVALLRALERVGRGRRRALVIAGAALIAAALGLFEARRRSVEADPCAGGEALAAGMWSDAARARVREAFGATGRPYAAATFARLDAVLAAKAGAW